MTVMKRLSNLSLWARTGVLLGGLTVVGGLLVAYRPLALDIRLQTIVRQPTPIQRIQQHQGMRLTGTTVLVEGEVGDRAPFIDFELYELRQDTDSLWVMTREPGAETGDRLRVRGRIQAETIEHNGTTTIDYYLLEHRRYEE